MNSTNDNDIGVLIMSCDKYYDMWDPFFYFFEKYWPDCPYPIYLATNSKIYARKNIQQIHSNRFTDWSDETYSILEQYPHKYLIYFQDDYFLMNKVNNNIIKTLIEKMIVLNADYLRLHPSPGPDQSIRGESQFGIISKDAAFRTSLHGAIWNKNAFMSILQKGESSWDFELNSPIRSKDYLFLSLVRQNKDHISKHIYPITYYYKTGVFKGKWMSEVVKICKKEGINLDLNYRGVRTRKMQIQRQLYYLSPIFLRHIYDFINNKYKKW